MTLGPTSAIGAPGNAIAPAAANDQSAPANAQDAAAAPAVSAPVSAPALPNGGAAVQVSLSSAAQAYLSQPDPPSLAEVQREKNKPKMKTLLEHMLEWSRKYEEQRDAAQKEKQLAPADTKTSGNAGADAVTPAALKIKKGADRTE